MWNTVVPDKPIHLATSTNVFTARNSYLGTDISNAVDYRTFSIWKAPDTGEQSIMINGIGGTGAVTAFAADTLCIANHNIGSLGLTIYVDSNTDTLTPGSWTNRASLSPTVDTPIFLTFTQQTVQYWRIRLTASGIAHPYIGLLYFGTKTTLTDSFDPKVDPRAFEPLFNREIRNEDGHLLPAAGRTLLREFDFKLEAAGSSRATHISELDGIVNHIQKMRPFFFNYNLDDTIFTNLILRKGGGAITRTFVSGSYARMGLDFTVVSASPEDI
jgi:hypothetical protein